MLLLNLLLLASLSSAFYPTPHSFFGRRRYLHLQLRGGTGKGDDTIVELNKLDGVVVDPALVDDPSFWDYVMVPNEHTYMHILRLEGEQGDANETLYDQGALVEDLDFHFDLFSPLPVSAAPSEAAGLVVGPRNFARVAATKGFDSFEKVILCRGRGGKDAAVDESGVEVSVGSLGELKALTICSYALLTKRS